jgi:hypothetical protein
MQWRDSLSRLFDRRQKYREDQGEYPRMTKKSGVTIEWTVVDIHTARQELGLPQWTNQQALESLTRLRDVITDRSIEIGWDIIRDDMRVS